MTNVYGYVRVSTTSQNYDSQVDAIQTFCKLKEYNLLRIFDDKRTGANNDRPGFQEMVKTLERNPQFVEAIVFTKIDRIGRSLYDLITFVGWCEKKNVGLVAIHNNLDTTSKEGRLYFHIMASLAEYERELINERTTEGRKRYLANGGKLGKPKLKIPTDEIKRLKNEGFPITRIAERFNVSRETIYKRLAE